MSTAAAIPVGVIVERVKAANPWIDYVWRPTAVLVGEPDAPPWTKLTDDGERATYYAGKAAVALHRAETSNYRDNLATGAPALWVVLRETEAEPRYSVHLVTADPAEGEGMTSAGNDIVEPVPMPDAVRETVAAFVEAHHVGEEFVKRTRDRADTELLGRRPPDMRKDER